MVEPTDHRLGRFWSSALSLSLLAGFSGCGLVPKSKMDECHRVTQTLRSENSRLKDVTLNLRAQNQDLSQRAVDDARQIAAKDEANEQLIKSVHAYQGERDQLAEAYQTLERQVRMAVNTHPVVRLSLKAFAEAHPGWSFDESAMSLKAPSARLFEKGSATLSAEALAALKALAAELSGEGADRLALEVVAPGASAPVVAAGFDPGPISAEVAAASARFLAAARAARVRDRLISEAGLDPASVRLAPRSNDAPDGGDDERLVEIRLATRPVEPRRD